MFAFSGAHDAVNRYVIAIFPFFVAGALLARRWPWVERIYLVAGALLAAHFISLFQQTIYVA